MARAVLSAGDGNAMRSAEDSGHYSSEPVLECGEMSPLLKARHGTSPSAGGRGRIRALQTLCWLCANIAVRYHPSKQ